MKQTGVQSTDAGVFGRFQRRALLLDLELGLDGRLRQIGALLGDETFAPSVKSARARPEALRALGELASRADCLVGHNLLAHDLPALRELAPNHPLLRLPVIDTLLLSPLCFPENPYHRLVKDYKLVREALNDPVADARQAGVLFRDEWTALTGMRQTAPELLRLLGFLLTADDDEAEPEPGAEGFRRLFAALKVALPDWEEAVALGQRQLRRPTLAGEPAACTAAGVDAALWATRAQRLTFAYAVTWLRVAGANSVLPPWVRLRHPAVGELVRRWREVPCGDPACAYCAREHNAREQFRRYSGYPGFRPEPRGPDGRGLQAAIVEAGLREESLLAILPTGGGKSLCFQVPALARNHRRGVLTIVISPLQALMKDQVDGLEKRTGTPFAAALSGLLTPPERGDVLRRVRMGDVAILYVSPEQLRNRTFRQAIAQREIGGWVFDEAHCLSKWGHDFRPDYLHAGRFIREFAAEQGVPIPPLACFTATAKREVQEEILAFFRQEADRELRVFEAGVERDNLRFEVLPVTAAHKRERLHLLLQARLPPGQPGGAIVFRAKRRLTEETAEYLAEKGWEGAHFHAGLTPPEKKRIQDAFLAGEVKVICATNAFGMGVDKEDVRLVVHADIPGSLENYLQEAGRAGRDGAPADCVLLYDEDDCEEQFRLGAMSELSRRDIAQILRGLRRAARRGGREEVVITAGEILRDEEVETEFEPDERSAATRVRTAISWLERAHLIRRDENVTRVFQARPLVRSLAEAKAKMAPLNLHPAEQNRWLAVLGTLMTAGASESLTVDELALLPEMHDLLSPEPDGTPPPPEQLSARILRLLDSMAKAGLLKRDTLLNAFVRHKVADHSRVRLERILALERAMLDLLQDEEPDPEHWLVLTLRPLNQRLLDQGLASSVEGLRRLVRSLSQDGRGFAGGAGSFELRHVSRESYRVRLRRSWRVLRETAERRQRTAVLVLDALLAKVPPDTPPRAELLVEFSFEELLEAVHADLLLRSDLKDPMAAVERALLFLHEQEVLVLQQGLAVFRSAMTLRLPPEAKGQPYRPADYQPLAHHYQERVLQVHVMNEYAQRGLRAIREALGLVAAYFRLGREAFIRRFLAARTEMLRHATTARSFQRIVTDLNNPAQTRLVTADLPGNHLILAGPGSGKTRTVVHRCAWLLRGHRVPPRSILVCTFNRHAALEVRRRLRDLVGHEARCVTILTYHALALRLLGRSFQTRPAPATGPEPETEPDFAALIPEAVRLLRGETTLPGLPPDEVRDRLLAGFRFILVDEYQDIDAPQYALISALAGRTLADPDQRLSILAVGDDDQNIYTFRGANVEFLRRFQEDYQAEVHYLVENYRATGHLIDAANRLIAANRDRLKTAHPIRIDRRREGHPPGGDFGQHDQLTGGRVHVLEVPDALAQAHAAVTELARWRRLGVEWSAMAGLASHHADLNLLRAAAEAAGIPVRCPAHANALPALWHVREIRRELERLKASKKQLIRASTWEASLPRPTAAAAGNPWLRFVRRMATAWREESGDSELPAGEALEFCYEYLAESRRQWDFGEGVTLTTVHGAKGCEFDHVILMGRWVLPAAPGAREELRRLFYVGMTRARQSLAVIDRRDLRPSLPATLDGPSVLRRQVPVKDRPALAGLRDYVPLGMETLNLGWAGRKGAEHRAHAALRELNAGDQVRLQADARGVCIHGPRDLVVGRLSQSAASVWMHRLETIREARVLAVIVRTAAQEAVADRPPPRSERWEVPLLELTVAGGVGAGLGGAARTACARADEGR